MLQRELNVAVNLEKAPKKSEEEEVEPNIVPLKEAYLSFNRWLDQVEDLNLELEPFFQIIYLHLQKLRFQVLLLQ